MDLPAGAVAKAPARHGIDCRAIDAKERCPGPPGPSREPS